MSEYLPEAQDTTADPVLSTTLKGHELTENLSLTFKTVKHFVCCFLDTFLSLHFILVKTRKRNWEHWSSLLKADNCILHLHLYICFFYWYTLFLFTDSVFFFYCSEIIKWKAWYIRPVATFPSSFYLMVSAETVVDIWELLNWY